MYDVLVPVHAFFTPSFLRPLLRACCRAGADRAPIGWQNAGLIKRATLVARLAPCRLPVLACAIWIGLLWLAHVFGGLQAVSCARVLFHLIFMHSVHAPAFGLAGRSRPGRNTSKARAYWPKTKYSPCNLALTLRSCARIWLKPSAADKTFRPCRCALCRHG